MDVTKEHCKQWIRDTGWQLSRIGSIVSTLAGSNQDLITNQDFAKDRAVKMSTYNLDDCLQVVHADLSKRTSLLYKRVNHSDIDVWTNSVGGLGELRDYTTQLQTALKLEVAWLDDEDKHIEFYQDLLRLKILLAVKMSRLNQEWSGLDGDDVPSVLTQAQRVLTNTDDTLLSCWSEIKKMIVRSRRLKPADNNLYNGFSKDGHDEVPRYDPEAANSTDKVSLAFLSHYQQMMSVVAAMLVEMQEATSDDADSEDDKLLGQIEDTLRYVKTLNERQIEWKETSDDVGSTETIEERKTASVDTQTLTPCLNAVQTQTDEQQNHIDDKPLLENPSSEYTRQTSVETQTDIPDGYDITPEPEVDVIPDVFLQEEAATVCTAAPVNYTEPNLLQNVSENKYPSKSEAAEAPRQITDLDAEDEEENIIQPDTREDTHQHRRDSEAAFQSLLAGLDSGSSTDTEIGEPNSDEDNTDVESIKEEVFLDPFEQISRAKRLSPSDDTQSQLSDTDTFITCADRDSDDTDSGDADIDEDISEFLQNDITIEADLEVESLLNPEFVRNRSNKLPNLESNIVRENNCAQEAMDSTPSNTKRGPKASKPVPTTNGSVPKHHCAGKQVVKGNPHLVNGRSSPASPTSAKLATSNGKISPGAKTTSTNDRASPGGRISPTKKTTKVAEKGDASKNISGNDNIPNLNLQVGSKTMRLQVSLPTETQSVPVQEKTAPQESNKASVRTKPELPPKPTQNSLNNTTTPTDSPTDTYETDESENEGKPRRASVFEIIRLFEQPPDMANAKAKKPLTRSVSVPDSVVQPELMQNKPENISISKTPPNDATNMLNNDVKSDDISREYAQVSSAEQIPSVEMVKETHAHPIRPLDNQVVDKEDKSNTPTTVIETCAQKIEIIKEVPKSGSQPFKVFPPRQNALPAETIKREIVEESKIPPLNKCPDEVDLDVRLEKSTTPSRSKPVESLPSQVNQPPPPAPTAAAPTDITTTQVRTRVPIKGRAPLRSTDTPPKEIAEVKLHSPEPPKYTTETRTMSIKRTDKPFSILDDDITPIRSLKLNSPKNANENQENIPPKNDGNLSDESDHTLSDMNSQGDPFDDFSKRSVTPPLDDVNFEKAEEIPAWKKRFGTKQILPSRQRLSQGASVLTQQKFADLRFEETSYAREVDFFSNRKVSSARSAPVSPAGSVCTDWDALDVNEMDDSASIYSCMPSMGGSLTGTVTRKRRSSAFSRRRRGASMIDLPDEDEMSGGREMRQRYGFRPTMSARQIRPRFTSLPEDKATNSFERSRPGMTKTTTITTVVRSSSLSSLSERNSLQHTEDETKSESNESVDIEEFRRKYFIRHVFDFLGTQMTLEEAVRRGIINLATCHYVNPFMNKTTVIETAIKQGFITVLSPEERIEVFKSRRVEVMDAFRTNKTSGAVNGEVVRENKFVETVEVPTNTAPQAAPSRYSSELDGYSQRAALRRSQSLQSTSTPEKPPQVSARTSARLQRQSTTGSGSTYGVITFNVERVPQPFYITEVLDTNTNATYNYDSATRFGLIDSNASIFVNKRTRSHMPLDDAIDQGYVQVAQNHRARIEAEGIMVDNFLVYGVMDVRNQKRITFKEAVDADILNPTLETFRNTGINREMPIDEGIECGLIISKKMTTESLRLYDGMIPNSNRISCNRVQHFNKHVPLERNKNVFMNAGKTSVHDPRLELELD